jgi:hypothetical protein
VKPLTIYIAGPMSGYPESNYPAFHAAEASLTQAGHKALNPAKLPECADWSGYMKLSIPMVCEADAIWLLPGWEKSKGACLELQIACALGLEVLGDGGQRKHLLGGSE